MKVEITDRFTWGKYIASTRGECKDEVDKKVFDLVQQHNDTIVMGAVIGVPERFFQKP